MKVAAKVNPNTKTPGIFAARITNGRIIIIDGNFREISITISGNQIIQFGLVSNSYMISCHGVVGVDGLCYLVLNSDDDSSVILCSKFNYESTNNTFKLSESHAKYFTYEYSKCGKYFLKIPNWETYINSILYNSPLLSKENLLVYDYLCGIIADDVAKMITMLVMDLKRLDYSTYKEVTLDQ